MAKPTILVIDSSIKLSFTLLSDGLCCNRLHLHSSLACTSQFAIWLPRSHYIMIICYLATSLSFSDGDGIK